MSLTIFAQRMKQAREENGLKLSELARVTNIRKQNLSLYEKSDTDGNGSKPSLENAKVIAEYLDVSLDWLCGMSDSETNISDFSPVKEIDDLLGLYCEGSLTRDLLQVCIHKVIDDYFDVRKESENQ